MSVYVNYIVYVYFGSDLGFRVMGMQLCYGEKSDFSWATD